MRILAVCEAPPTIDAAKADGSTLISRHVLANLPADVELDLISFTDRDVAVDGAVQARAGRCASFELRSALGALATLPLQRAPRATWRRTTAEARRAVAEWSTEVDVTYVHGLHAFGLARESRAPVVVNEVDPWSLFWEERASGRSFLAASYDRVQAARARRLELATSRIASGYIVVNEADGERLGTLLDRPIDVLPNGLDATITTGARADDPVVVFVGTLDYAPNVSAVECLVREVLPSLRRRVPQARLVIAGRRPTREVRALEMDGVEVLADVPSVSDVFARAAVAAYPTTIGRGTKNSVLEALAAGCPVVALPAAASGIEPGPHLAVVPDPEAMATALAGLLTDPERRRLAAVSAGEAIAGRRWDAVAERYLAVFRRAVSDPERRLRT